MSSHFDAEALHSDTLPPISLTNVSVEIPIFSNRSRSLRHSVLNMAIGGLLSQGRRSMTIRALHNINLDIQYGDRIALIGHNGAGKTTLLKVLAGIYEPTFGRVEIRRKVTPLFDMSLGVDEEMTGYEAIRFGCMLRGIGRDNLKEVAEEIADFAELGVYLSLPIRVYSAGMRARLAFAVTTCQRPEILVLDEGIGAGDAQFMEKVQQRTRQFYGQARALILASHSTGLLQSICNKGLVLKNGSTFFFGGIDDAISAYGNGSY